MYDASTKLCICQPANATVGTNQFVTAYLSTKKTCACPSNLVLITGTSVCACGYSNTTPLYYQTIPAYDATTSSCLCPAKAGTYNYGTVWNNVAKLCECPQPTATVSGTARLQWNAGTTNRGCDCPPSTTLTVATMVCTCNATGKNWNGSACV